MAALLLALMVALPLLCLTALQLRQLHLKHEAKERMEKTSLQTIHLTELSWEKKGKELRISGKLFDVSSVEKTGSGYKVRGIWDHQEMAIEKSLASQQAPGQSSVMLILLLPLFLFTVIGAPQAMILLITKKYFSSHPSLYRIDTYTTSPPPWRP